MTTAIHRCKVCNNVARVEYRCKMANVGYGRKEAIYYRESDGRRHVQPVICCGKETKWGFLKAFVNPTVKCDARCTHAKGFRCECSCGGENHATGGMFTSLVAA